MADDHATLQAQYLAKVEADFERNTVERERILGEVAALRSQLESLDLDRDVLTGIRKALTSKPLASHERGSDGVDRSDGASGQGVVASVPAQARGRGRRQAAPTLRELVETHLGTCEQPTSATEVAAALNAVHPERSIQITVVRNTLEGLVAKGQVHRIKQKRAVFYQQSGSHEQAGPGKSHRGSRK